MDEKKADPETSAPIEKSTPVNSPPKTKKKVKQTRRALPKRKTKKRPYPSVLLERALQVPLQIKEKNGGNPWTPRDVATAIGVAPKSSDFFYITAASRDFGMSIGTRETETIELTDLGREVVYAPSPEAEHQKKLQAFYNIELFAKVLKHYQGSDLPEMKYLGNTLQREFGLDPEYHDDFSTVFRENCKFLNIGAGEALPDLERPRTVIVGEPSKKTSLKAFVIMPFVEKNPQRPAGFFTEVLTSLITPAATEAGFLVETANRQGSDLIQSTIVNELLDAELVIADLTDHNPNVMFELGLRMAEDKPVAIIKAAGTGRVFDVDNMLRVFEYNPNLWRSTIEVDLPNLAKHVRMTWENREKDKTYMSILRSKDNRA